MIVWMDNISAPSSRELAQRLYDKNIELENKRRRSAQARIPSDPNAWQQMRENFEAIILEDHAFSEQHNIEYALWQLHYKRIEELRAHLSGALASAGSTTSQDGKVPTRPDRITKIRLQLKTFLSEATGFYHDLILKIRAKYGLPLGHFSEDSDNRVIMEKGGKKSTETKPGLISCHRCLIYLGDLARYKGLYADGDSKSRDYAAASSYYLQAASICPSSGNPHHQLAILASYSGDELVAVYRYFRSLAVDSPFSTARDNLIVAFEKNRKSYSQLLGDSKASAFKESTLPMTSKGRGKEEAKPPSKDTSMEANLAKERASSMHETYKAFCIRFVRLNGILFTRTSLETFAEVLSFVSSSLCQLLSSGPEEELNFGRDAAENGFLIVRLISILIFTVHIVNREVEGQSYAEILQRKDLLQDAFAAVFDFMGHILKRCLQLRDPSSSYLLPGILVFVEWLACCPDVASGSDMDEQQATVRSLFWNHCITFLNKLLSNRSVSVDDEDESCFFNMSKYEEGETGNRLALWEDFELKGFLPLLPAQSILDFSRKNSFRSDRNKEEKSRVKRILAAGKVLTNVVRVNQKAIYFDSNMKKFIIEPELPGDKSGILKSNGIMQESPAEKITNSGVVHPKEQLYMEGEDDDEEIVFKPTSSEKRTDAIGARCTPYEGLEPGQSSSAEIMHIYGSSLSPPFINLRQQAVSNASSQPPLSVSGTPYEGLEPGPSSSAEIMHIYGSSLSPPFINLRQQAVSNASSQPPLSVSGIVPKHLQPIHSHASNWLVEQEVSLANGLKGLGLMGNGHVTTMDLQENTGISQAYPASHSLLPRQSVNVDASGIFYSQTTVPETLTISRVDTVASSGVRAGKLAASTSSALPVSSRKIPVSRPVRHLGPPPGFTSVPIKHANEPISGSDSMSENQLIADYSWLDGYKLPSTKGLGINNSINTSSHANSQVLTGDNSMPGTNIFPFPGKQFPRVQFQMEKHNGWQHNQPLDHLKHEQQLQYQQQRMDGTQEFIPIHEQYQGKNFWMGPHFE